MILSCRRGEPRGPPRGEPRGAGRGGGRGAAPTWSQGGGPNNRYQETSSEKVNINDLLSPPGRFSRPTNLVIILRGPPGSGKTYVRNLIRVSNLDFQTYKYSCIIIY